MRQRIRIDNLGTARRLRALFAIGYPGEQLATALQVSTTTVYNIVNALYPTVDGRTARRVVEMYDRLSMTPGPSDKVRRRARRMGWAPPLAWDDDTIDDREAQADTPGKRTRRPPYRERFLELRELGYTDLQIADRWQIRPGSLLRQLIRHNIDASPLLVEEANRAKYAREAAS